MANSVFDKDGDKAISKEEYETEEETVIRHKTYMFQNMPFDSLDIVKNGVIDIHDISSRILRQKRQLGFRIHIFQSQ